jgi:chromate transporter
MTPAPPDAAAAIPGPPVPTSRNLFVAFAATSVVAFGGALPLARRMIVERKHWLTAAEFTELLALCQFLPGPNIVNVTVALGARFRGVPGALAALAGLLAAPMAIAIGLGAAYARFGGLATVRHGFAGLAAAAAGLILATACKIAWPIRKRPLDVALAAVAFGAIAVFRLPLLPAMLALVPVGILMHRRGTA